MRGKQWLMIALLFVVCLRGASAWGVALVQSDPQNGAVLTHAPKSVTLHFDGMVDPAKTRLNLSEAGGRSTPPLPRQRKATGATDTLTVVLPVLGRGSYILRYKVVGTDGRATNGSISFTAGGY